MVVWLTFLAKKITLLSFKSCLERRLNSQDFYHMLSILRFSAVPHKCVLTAAGTVALEITQFHLPRMKNLQWVVDWGQPVYVPRVGGHRDNSRREHAWRVYLLRHLDPE